MYRISIFIFYVKHNLTSCHKHSIYRSITVPHLESAFCQYITCFFYRVLIISISQSKCYLPRRIRILSRKTNIFNCYICIFYRNTIAFHIKLYNLLAGCRKSNALNRFIAFFIFSCYYKCVITVLYTSG
ncbi:MAG: hypothetical protein BWY67_02293 [Bacteroidetes bacterium ADurb.Bin397]|nr:MAG: hypothetical protein BWY67_02293 [Bacteroidetes bacterium ADurb.Bin397]